MPLINSIIKLMILASVTAFAGQAPVDSIKKPEQSQEEQRRLLVGTWYGEYALADGGTRSQITRRALDGTYRVQFRTREASGRTWDQTEVGFWGVSGSVYFTITRGLIQGQSFIEADPTDADLNDAYYILELNDETFRYRTIASGNEYQLERVDDTFQFPDQAGLYRYPEGAAGAAVVAWLNND